MSDENVVDFFKHLDTPKGELPSKPGKPVRRGKLAGKRAPSSIQAFDVANDVNSEEGQPNRLTDVNDVARFLMAGKAKVTFVSVKTGTRFTYKISRLKQDGKPKLGGPWFVAVLTGSNNETDFSYLGTIFEPNSYNAPNTRGSYRHGRKSKISPDAPSAKAFDWVARNVLEAGVLPKAVEVYHEGSCGRCGRALTVPESIRTGLGPICAGEM